MTEMPAIRWPTDGSTKGRLRSGYEVGLLARGAWATLLAYGRSLGLTVQDFPGGGWWSRSGYLVVEGRSDALWRFVAAWKRLAEEAASER